MVYSQFIPRSNEGLKYRNMREHFEGNCCWDRTEKFENLARSLTRLRGKKVGVGFVGKCIFVEERKHNKKNSQIINTMDCKITIMSDQRENVVQEVEILQNTAEETLKWREVSQYSPWIVKDIKDVDTKLTRNVGSQKS